jgi:hypothetical protein
LAKKYPGKLDLDYRDRPKVPSTYPNGCHVCELEIEAETGDIEILSYVAVDDAGTIINHQIVEGQMQGGITQGAGHILGEEAIYDRDTGQLLSDLHGLPDAARGPVNNLRVMDYPVPDEDQSARRQGRRRSGSDRLDALHHERGDRCVAPGGRDALRHAGDAPAAVGRDPRREGRKAARVCNRGPTGRVVRAGRALSTALRLSIFYFAYFAHLGAFVAYFSLWLQARGYSPAQIAAVLAVPAVLRIFAPALWGWLADSAAARLPGGHPGFVAPLAALAAGAAMLTQASDLPAVFGWAGLTALSRPRAAARRCDGARGSARSLGAMVREAVGFGRSRAFWLRARGSTARRSPCSFRWSRR